MCECWAVILYFGFRRQAKVIFEHLKIQNYRGYQELTLRISQPSPLYMKD